MRSLALVAGVFLGTLVQSGLVVAASLRGGRSSDRRLQPWVDPNDSQHALFRGGFGAEQWAQLGVTSAVWLVLPLAVGVVTLLRSEVK